MLNLGSANAVAVQAATMFEYSSFSLAVGGAWGIPETAAGAGKGDVGVEDARVDTCPALECAL